MISFIIGWLCGILTIVTAPIWIRALRKLGIDLPMQANVHIGDSSSSSEDDQE